MMEKNDNGTVEEQAGEGLSILQQTEAELRKESGNLTLAVPSWGERLFAEYEILDPEELARQARTTIRKLQQYRRNGTEPSEQQRHEAELQMINTACVGLWTVRLSDGERVLVESEDGPVTWSSLAAVMGWDHLKSTFETIRYCFGQRDPNNKLLWRDNFVALSMHANRINEYFKDPTKRGLDLAELVGEL